MQQYGILVSLTLLAFGVLSLHSSCTPVSSIEIVNSELTAREFTGDQNVKNSMAVLTGTARNTKDSSIRNCIITVTFYDTQKNSIGVVSTARESLGPGETWSFVVQLTSPDAWKARSYNINVSNN